VSAIEIIGAVGAPVVAVAAIAANVWITKRNLDDRREDRLWSNRAQLYIELVRLMRHEEERDPEELLMTIDTLDQTPATYWQSERDRDPRAWDDREVRVLTYASDRTRALYFEWDRALLQLAGIVQPTRMTGTPRPEDVRSAVKAALSIVATTGARLVEQIRSELQPVRESIRGSRRIMRGRH
jgi:hypothetical protein